ANPTNAPSVSIKATAGSVTGQAVVSVNCSSTSAPPPSSNTGTAPPPPPPSTGGSPVLRPPNTGDAGLSAGNGSRGWSTYAGLVAVAGSPIGSLALVAKARA